MACDARRHCPQRVSSSCSSRILISSSSSVRSCNARWRRKETRGPSCTSPTPRVQQQLWPQERPVCTPKESPWSLLALRLRLRQDTGRLPELAVFGARGPQTSHALHHGCDEGRQPAPLRRSVARAEASSAAVAPTSASRRSLRHQHEANN